MGAKYKIEVQVPGGIPGFTSGDIIEDPTPAQIERAKANPTCARLHEIKPSKGGRVDEEGMKDGRNNTSRNRGDRTHMGHDG